MMSYCDDVMGMTSAPLRVHATACNQVLDMKKFKVFC